MKKYFVLLITISVLASFAGFVVAEDLGTQCAIVSETTDGCPNISETECKALLQRCADYYDAQSAAISEDLTKTSAEKKTLQNEIYKLSQKIKGANAEINKSGIMVKDLGIQIVDTQDSIVKTSDNIISLRDQMVGILRTIYEEDKKSSFMILLEGDLSDFFSNLAYLEGLNGEISELIDSTKSLKKYLEVQEVKMSDNVDQLQKTIAIQKWQKKQNESNKQEQDGYLKLTEAQYQAQLKDKQEVEAKASKIKAMLFSVAGGGTKVPTFGEAIEIAKSVASSVGIRPAFLLAIISQESAIGRDVGQCMLVDPETGAGKKISTGAPIIRIMKPMGRRGRKGDVDDFIRITTALGRNPYDTPISCWIPAYVKGQPFGYGGAMGPAQFIASTWAGYESRLKKILGRTPDPWLIKDAFTASGLYLADLGATAQTRTAESRAAGGYYGISDGYSSPVLARADCIQSFIDTGTMSSFCQRKILGGQSL